MRENFLAKETLYENKIIRYSNLIIFSGVLISIVLSFCLIAQIITYVTYDNFYESKINPVILNEYEEAKRVNQTLAKSNEHYNYARKGHVEITKIITAIVNSMNDNIWVQKVSMNKSKITISGEATNTQALDTFISKLQIANYSTQLDNVTNAAKLSFTITATAAKDGK